jgi:hypothetical protein
VLELDNVTNLQLPPSHLNEDAVSHSLNRTVVDHVVISMTLVVFIHFFDGVDKEHENEDEQRGKLTGRRQARNELQNGNEQKVNVGHTLELVEEKERQKRQQVVLVRDDNVVAKLLLMVFCRVVGKASSLRTFETLFGTLVVLFGAS